VALHRGPYSSFSTSPARTWQTNNNNAFSQQQARADVNEVDSAGNIGERKDLTVVCLNEKKLGT